MAADEARPDVHPEPAPGVPVPAVRDGDPATLDWDYTPPSVTYDPITEDVNVTLNTGETRQEIKTVGYVVNPKFGIDWPHLQTLRHFAALIEHRTGLRVRVAQNDVEEQECFEVRTSHSTGGPAPYEVVYAWLSGFENGSHETLWAATKRPPKA